MAQEVGDMMNDKTLYMKTRTHPNFILGLFSLLMLFIGIGLQANGYAAGDTVIIGSLALGGIHWIWSIIDVLKDYRTGNDREERNIVWVIVAVIPVGGILYYGLGRKVRM